MNTSLAISCGFMGLCCLLAAFSRIIVSRTVNSPLIKELLYEAIAAAELCSCCFELIIGKYNAFVKQNNPIFQINALKFLSFSALILSTLFLLLQLFHIVAACWSAVAATMSGFYYTLLLLLLLLKKKNLLTYSCRQFWCIGLCDMSFLFDNFVVNGLGRCNGMPIHTHGRYARGKNIGAFGCVENMGTIDGRLLYLSLCANILVV